MPYSLGRSILEGFGNVNDADGVGTAEVGDGARHFEDSMVGSGR